MMFNCLMNMHEIKFKSFCNKSGQNACGYKSLGNKKECEMKRLGLVKMTACI